MSYSFNQRKKLIHRMKKQYGKGWYAQFRIRVNQIVNDRQGPSITLEELMRSQVNP